MDTCTPDERELLDRIHQARLEDVDANSTSVTFRFDGFRVGYGSGHDLAKAMYAAKNNPQVELDA